MIQGIFYARFFPQEGTKIVAQSPPGCIVPLLSPSHPSNSTDPTSSPSPLLSSSTTQLPQPPVSHQQKVKYPLFDFSVLSEYIIPRQAFCNRYITVLDPDSKYFVLGFPVSIPSPRYDRNEFIFNFGIVVDHDVDQVPYERVVRRLAITFAEMERQSGYLSLAEMEGECQREWAEGVGKEGEGGNSGPASNGMGGANDTGTGTTEGMGERYKERRPIESLLEIVKEDLNNYGECMIPVDDANTINMKLFPYHPVPAEVKGWHVPVAKMKFADVVDPTWDLTLQKVIQHIDGVSDVRRIAWQADVSLELTQLALRHLLYYDTILLLDMFFFGACYAPRPGIHDFIANVGGLVDECANYVCVGAVSTANSTKDAGKGSDKGSLMMPPPSSTTTTGSAASPSLMIGSLPTSKNGSSNNGGGPPAAGHRISNHMLIKLMTTFCVGKTVMEWLKGHLDAGFDVLRFVDVRRLVQFGIIKGCLYRVHKYVVSKQYLAALATGQARPLAGGDPLQKYTDGCHSFDQIITEQNLTDAEIVGKLKSFQGPAGDLTVFYK
ncbi:nitrogen permease regulator 2 [Cladorrhinum sp. PSN259]|nr:nitrogen permease regulator 2 [Cladorrhinum sp. PSN259]